MWQWTWYDSKKHKGADRQKDESTVHVYFVPLKSWVQRSLMHNFNPSY